MVVGEVDGVSGKKEREEREGKSELLTSRHCARTRWKGPGASEGTANTRSRDDAQRSLVS